MDKSPWLDGRLWLAWVLYLSALMYVIMTTPPPVLPH